MVGLCFIPYDLHRYSKCSLSSLLLSYIKSQHCGYLHNQFLFTNFAMQSELLSKISLAVSSSLLLTVCLHNRETMGNSTISNQLEARLIMVRAMKSICKLSLPLRVYGPMRLTHKHSQRLLMMVLGGRWPYLSFCLLFVWQVLQGLVIDWMVVYIPFQYIVALIVSLRRVCPGCCKEWWYHLTARTWRGLEITSWPSLQTHIVFSMSLISNPVSITALRLKRCFRVALARWASAISLVVRGYILPSLLRFAKTTFVGMEWFWVDALYSL